MSETTKNTEVVEKLISETAKISWLELQRFFAQGVVLNVDSDLDLIEIAQCLAADDSERIKALMNDDSISQPSNDQARHWYETKAEMWSVVVAPFVLVQAIKS